MCIGKCAAPCITVFYLTSTKSAIILISPELSTWRSGESSPPRRRQPSRSTKQSSKNNVNVATPTCGLRIKYNNQFNLPIFQTACVPLASYFMYNRRRLPKVSCGNGSCCKRNWNLRKPVVAAVSMFMRAWLCSVTASSSSSERGGMSVSASHAASSTHTHQPSSTLRPLERLHSFMNVLVQTKLAYSFWADILWLPSGWRLPLAPCHAALTCCQHCAHQYLLSSYRRSVLSTKCSQRWQSKLQLQPQVMIVILPVVYAKIAWLSSLALAWVFSNSSLNYIGNVLQCRCKLFHLVMA